MDTVTPAEFEVGLIKLDGQTTHVSGRNYEKDLYIGDVFYWLYRVTSREIAEHEFSHEYTDERTVNLQIVAIEFHQRATDVLGPGETGWLHLAGSGGNQLQPFGQSPLSYDLLRFSQFA